MGSLELRIDKDQGYFFGFTINGTRVAIACQGPVDKTTENIIASKAKLIYHGTNADDPLMHPFTENRDNNVVYSNAPENLKREVDNLLQQYG